MLNKERRASDRFVPVGAGVRVSWAPSIGGVDFRSRHPMLTIALHWGTALVLVVAVCAMFLRDAAEDKSLRQVLLEVHRQLGLLVLLAVGWRIARRVRPGLTDHAANMPLLVKWAAHIAHVLLYALLIALPVVGWALTSAHGIKLSLFGAIPLPSLVEADSDLADALSDYHVWLAWGLQALVGAHLAAALWHHFVRRDPVLRAMMPRRSSRRSL
jgi:cytochrome b561